MANSSEPDFELRHAVRILHAEPGKDNRVSLFDAGTVQLLDPRTQFYQADKKAFGPRVGLTWAPSALQNRTVIRVGAGVYYGPGQYEDLIQPIESDVRSIYSRQSAISRKPCCPYVGHSAAASSASV